MEKLGYENEDRKGCTLRLLQKYIKKYNNAYHNLTCNHNTSTLVQKQLFIHQMYLFDTIIG